MINGHDEVVRHKLRPCFGLERIAFAVPESPSEYSIGMIRASNTQPALVMRFEASTENDLRAIRGPFEERLKQAAGL